MTLRLLSGCLLLGLLLVCAPGSAAAASWTCGASGVSAAIGPAPPIEPITANRGASECSTQSAGGELSGLPLGATGSLLFARTRADGDASRPAAQRVSAESGIADLHIPLLPGLPGLPLPTPPVIDVPGFGSIDLGPAVRAVAAPQGDLLRLRALTARATGQCLSGRPALTGSSTVARLTVLGVNLATDRAVSRTITIDSRSIDPSTLDPTSLAPPGVDLAAFKAAIQPVLDALPDIQIPEALASVRVTPAEQVRRGDTLTERALAVRVSIGGQSVLDVAGGEASVGGTGIDCGSAVAVQALRCTTRRLVLIDVVRRGHRVRLFGAADRALAGRRVSIVYTDTNRRVARPRVGRDGLFRATAPLPPLAVRHTNRARYQARLAGERSLRLKLQRRLHITSTKPHGRAVVLAGRISSPLASPIQRVVVTRRVSCGRVEVVKRFKPRRDGSFRVKLQGAKQRQVATFRFRTKVRFRVGNPRLFRTFTLPQYVDIG
ncbi:MAG: hypothetical protein QOC68_3341 [Solirubrobacteraceae bacterium]|nr:hypothetical protein [Solirubrobacteraceae bacterium]